MTKDYRYYFIYADRGNGIYELAAWYYAGEEKKVQKESSFLASKGYKVKITTKDEGDRFQEA